MTLGKLKDVTSTSTKISVENFFTQVYEILQEFILVIPYTRVNKCMHLFAKLQGNMRLIPNMCLIAKGKIDHTSKTTMPLLVACVLDSK